MYIKFLSWQSLYHLIVFKALLCNLFTNYFCNPSMYNLIKLQVVENHGFLKAKNPAQLFGRTFCWVLKLYHPTSRCRFEGRRRSFLTWQKVWLAWFFDFPTAGARTSALNKVTGTPQIVQFLCPQPTLLIGDWL